DGNVWGTDVYTDDSSIATAAVHAGLVKPGERAIVTLTIVESPEQHRGTTRNGVTSRVYGPFASSFILQRAAEAPAVQRAPSIPRGQRHSSGSGVSKPLGVELKWSRIDRDGDIDLDGDAYPDLYIFSPPEPKTTVIDASP